MLREHEELQKREADQRKLVEDLKQEINNKKQQHSEFMAKNQKDLGVLKDDLMAEKERIQQCLNLLEKELKGGENEMTRLRLKELESQR